MINAPHTAETMTPTSTSETGSSQPFRCESAYTTPMTASAPASAGVTLVEVHIDSMPVT